MNSRYLPSSRTGFQTIAMRLPRSSTRPLSVRFVTISLISTIALAIAPCANARQETPQLVCSPSNARFRDVLVGQTASQEIVLTNTGETSTSVSAISVSSSEFSVSGGANLPMMLNAGQSITLNVTFSPNTAGQATGIITITTSAGNPAVLIGTEGWGTENDVLTANPSSLSFGQMYVGSSATHSIVLTNPHPQSKTITALQTTGTGFSVSGPTMPVTLSTGQSVTINVSFEPQGPGPAVGNIYVEGASLNLFLTGTGMAKGQLSVAPSTLSFGNVSVGTSTTQPSTMTATGGSVTVSSASSSNSQFSISGISLPVTISAGQTVSFDVVFAPTTSGADSATLTFASNATSQSGESLSGTGVQQQYSVNLSWNPSTSSIAGYNVYRGTTPGSYSRINPSLEANSSYTDNTVASGMTYYYAATAVNSSGQESAYSKPLEVVIP
jgi:Abnormal spindle-like microcephaly-assoc'd, ASPM-SPD-2-Hydin